MGRGGLIDNHLNRFLLSMQKDPWIRAQMLSAKDQNIQEFVAFCHGQAYLQ